MHMEIPVYAGLTYEGHYGIGKMAGIAVHANAHPDRGTGGGYLVLYPRNTRGGHGACHIEIPLGQAEEFITLIRAELDHIREEGFVDEV
jgi:hypothetical protein